MLDGTNNHVYILLFGMGFLMENCVNIVDPTVVIGVV